MSPRLAFRLPPAHSFSHGAPRPARLDYAKVDFEECKFCPDNEQYVIEDDASCCDTCVRVLFSNPRSELDLTDVQRKKRKNSLLGLTGHFERSSAWTHIFASALFLLALLIRTLLGFPNQSTAAILVISTEALSVVVFAVSTTYHSLGPNLRFMSILRLCDHSVILVSMAVALVSDVAIATAKSESPPPWQTWSDPCIAALLLLLFFSYRRAVLDPRETLGTFGDCRLGMLRMQHADGKCGPARSTGYLVLALSFVLIAPCYVDTLGATEATVSITCSLVGFLLLVLGLFIDNIMAWPDVHIMRELGAALNDILTSTKFTFTVPGTTKSATESRCEEVRTRSSLADACSSQYFGCIMTSHALWHICTVFSVCVLCFGREFTLVSAGL